MHMDIEAYKKAKHEHMIARKLFEYNMKRVLPRPQTTWVVVAFVVLGFLLISALWVVSMVICIHMWGYVLFLSILYAIFFDGYMRFLCITMVKCYQHYASEETRRRCMCVPSCSIYAIEVLKRNLLVIGLYKVYKRGFRTCLGDGFKIDLPYRKYAIPDLEMDEPWQLQ